MVFHWQLEGAGYRDCVTYFSTTVFWTYFLSWIHFVSKISFVHLCAKMKVSLKRFNLYGAAPPGSPSDALA